MKKIILFSLGLLFLSNAFAKELPNSRKFLNHFKPLVGQYFEGTITSGGREGDDFTGKRLIMYVMSYDDRQVKIPFFVGDDKSRTWVLNFHNGRIELKHDHRHEDGTPDDVTYYGGTANNEGGENFQSFPADDETCRLINFACQNVWWITVNKDKFSYNLRNVGSDRRFSVEFDLTKPIECNFKPW